MEGQDSEIERIRRKKMEQMKNAESGKSGPDAGNRKPEPKVIVYSTQTCPYCTMAKDYLKGKGVKFEDYDVSRDRDRAREMVAKTGQMGVPVIDINGKIMVGFDKAGIDQALAAPKKNMLEAKNNIIFELPDF